MHRYQTLPQPSLRTGTRVQKVDVSALATRRNCSFYLFGGMGIDSLVTILLEPWPDLYRNAIAREGEDWINLLQATAARIELTPDD